MFPSVLTDTEENNVQSLREQIISTSTEVAKTPLIDFKTKKLVLVNGTPKLTYNIEAVRQWIILFITTPKGACRIYDGTNFGTSIRKLFGSKRLNNGFEESEVEREIREGFPLCPAINRVTDFNLTKVGRIVKVYVQVELFDGTLIDESVDVVYTMK